MVGITEVIETMAAMVIFSLILLSANRMIIRNTQMQITGEMEQEVIAVAQDVIEESRTKEFDAKTTGALPPTNIPGDFTSPSALGPESSETSRGDFNDFDDYNNWKDFVTTEHGTFKVWAHVFYVDPVTYDSTGNRTTFKKIRVFVSSKYLNKSSDSKKYNFEFIRNYYAD